MEENNCLNCGRRIANPVGKSCRMRELNAWLKEQKISLNTVSLILSESELIFSHISHRNVSCILCHKLDVSICTPCFFSHAETILVNHKVSKAKIEKFQETFHYHLYDKEMVPKDLD